MKFVYRFFSIVFSFLLMFNVTFALEASGDGHKVGKGCEALHNAIDEAAGGASAASDVIHLFPQQFCTAGSLLSFVLNLLFTFSGLIAVLYIMIGGYQYMMGVSAGGKEAAGKGKTTITNAIIGLIVIIMASAIVNILIRLLM